MESDHLVQEATSRRITTPQEDSERELEWWRRYAEFEDRFAWVQTPEVQRILRGPYVREIVRLAGKGTILELGCGVGWLSLILAEAGASHVLGIDFSEAQISLAKKRASNSKAGASVEFKCSDGTFDALDGKRFDCVLLHAFLHHLDQSEIAQTIAGVSGLLKPGGILVALEPVSVPIREHHEPSKVERALNFLGGLANVGRRIGMRRFSSEETRWRKILAERNWGRAPRGPSPKEQPFHAGELESYLTPYFDIEQRVPCLARTHLVVQEWLLRAVSHPISTKIALPLVTRLSAYLERKLMAQAPTPNVWYFTLFVARKRRSSDQDTARFRG